MARPLRYEAAGGVYHLMARGDGGKDVFEDDKGRFAWTDLLEEAHGRFGWRVHAWVLMGNHSHLLLETPEPNLVSGMKWMLRGFLPRMEPAASAERPCLPRSLQVGVTEFRWTL